MKSRRRRAAALLAVAVVLTMTPTGGARATEPPPAADTADTPVDWCIRGGVFAVLFSAAFAVPTAILGGGAPYTVFRAGTAAVLGCGVAVTWRGAARGVAYVDGLINPPPPYPPDPPEFSVPGGVPASPVLPPLVRTAG